MTIRTTIKDSNYFEARLFEIPKFLAEDYEALADGEIAPDRIKSYKKLIFNEHLRLAITKYSAGLPIVSMKPDLLQALSIIEEVWDYPKNPSESAYYYDSYNDLLWLVSLCVLLHFSEAEILPILAIVDNARSRDWLLDFLLSNWRSSSDMQASILFSKPYETLYIAVAEEGLTTRSFILKRYLEKEWYVNHKRVYWYDNHKGKHDTFFGYWSFKPPTVVKIAGIDDSSFREHAYYPKDMLG